MANLIVRYARFADCYDQKAGPTEETDDHVDVRAKWHACLLSGEWWVFAVHFPEQHDRTAVEATFLHVLHSMRAVDVPAIPVCAFDFAVLRTIIFCYEKSALSSDGWHRWIHQMGKPGAQTGPLAAAMGPEHDIVVAFDPRADIDDARMVQVLGILEGFARGTISLVDPVGWMH